ncbi:MAG: hypothetical protein ABI169_07795 [Chitinophagaceae bacterium]
MTKDREIDPSIHRHHTPTSTTHSNFVILQRIYLGEIDPYKGDKDWEIDRLHTATPYTRIMHPQRVCHAVSIYLKEIVW